MAGVRWLQLCHLVLTALGLVLIVSMLALLAVNSASWQPRAVRYLTTTAPTTPPPGHQRRQPPGEPRVTKESQPPPVPLQQPPAAVSPRRAKTPKAVNKVVSFIHQLNQKNRLWGPSEMYLAALPETHIEFNRTGPARLFYPGGFDSEGRVVLSLCPSTSPVSSPSLLDLSSPPAPIVIALVNSAPSNVDSRNAVRATWAAANATTDSSGRRWMAVAFVVGRSGNQTVEKELLEEQDKHGDLLRPALQDTYRNLTIKTVSMLDWFVQRCLPSGAPLLLKVDDDVALNVGRFRTYVESLVQNWKRRSAQAPDAQPAVAYGRAMKRLAPFRQINHKYFVSKRQWPHRIYPNFLSGPAYMLSAVAVALLRNAILANDSSIPFVPMEDVQVTGVAAARAGVSLVSVGRWLGSPRSNDLIRRQAARSGTGACSRATEMALHTTSAERMKQVMMLFSGRCEPMDAQNAGQESRRSGEHSKSPPAPVTSLTKQASLVSAKVSGDVIS